MPNERLGALPVSAAAIGANIPFDDTEWDSHVHHWDAEPEHGKEPSAEINIIAGLFPRYRNVDPGRGRAFGPQDTYNGPRGTQSRDGFAGIARAVIVDDSFVRKFFPGKDPIGQQVDDNQSPKEKHAPPLTVIGVVPRTRNEAPGENNVEKFNFPQMYWCSAQCPQDENTLLIRVAHGDPLAMVNVIKHEVQTLDPDQPMPQSQRWRVILPASGCAAIDHDIARSICRSRACSRQRRPLWRHGAQRHAAHARARD
jgi:hypothetical protein